MTTTQKYMKFKILAGEHHEVISAPDEKIARFRKYVAGQVLKSKRDLVVEYPNKFERVFDDLAVANEADFVGVDSPDATAGSQLAVDAIDAAVATMEPPKKEVDPAEGWKDVTEKFPRAVRGGVTVWQNGNNFNVIDGDDSVLNDTPLTRLNANKFLARNY